MNFAASAVTGNALDVVAAHVEIMLYLGLYLF